ncbi:MAG: hypothetical protein J7549_03720 [Variovorax sp.]|nr:hypothetical protein [Variovorax sp.]
MTVASDIDGVYNRAEEMFTPVRGGLPGLSAKAHQIRVSSSGTKLELCDDGFFVIARIDACASIIHYTGTGTASGGTWTFVNDADSTDGHHRSRPSAATTRQAGAPTGSTHRA